ncbi:MAG: glyoxalase, partial [Acidimicrobiia bacterium]|nr:glyoxalase [Acidimicrobiia bacterium]
MASGPVLVSVTVADAPEAWSATGFTVVDGSCQVGQVRFDLGADGTGVVAWGLTDVSEGPLDGLDTRSEAAADVPPSVHPNGTVSLDHLVVMSLDVDRSRAALEERGFEVRRTADMGDRR